MTGARTIGKKKRGENIIIIRAACRSCHPIFELYLFSQLEPTLLTQQTSYETDDTIRPPAVSHCFVLVHFLATFTVPLQSVRVAPWFLSHIGTRKSPQKADYNSTWIECRCASGVKCCRNMYRCLCVWSKSWMGRCSVGASSGLLFAMLMQAGEIKAWWVGVHKY